jgi:hypothetical protein
MGSVSSIMTIIQPLGRETIIDRRQPALRWSAVFAATAVALGVWLFLQVFGSAVALCTVDANAVDRGYIVGVGSTAWSAFSLVVAMAVGGMLAARLAGFRERRIAGLHAVLVWAFGSLLGFLLISTALSVATPDLRANPAYSSPLPGDRVMVERALAPINLWLDTQSKPRIEFDEFVEASRRAVTLDGYDRQRLISELDDHSALTRNEVQSVIPQLGSSNDVIIAAARIGEHRADSIRAAHAAGGMFIVAALALALGLIAAVGGALLVVREIIRRTGYLDEPRHTAPYGVPVQHPVDTDVDDDIP